jgi:hypothetical protein
VQKRQCQERIIAEPMTVDELTQIYPIFLPRPTPRILNTEQPGEEAIEKKPTAVGFRVKEMENARAAPPPWPPIGGIGTGCWGKGVNLLVNVKSPLLQVINPKCVCRILHGLRRLCKRK